MTTHVYCYLEGQERARLFDTKARLQGGMERGPSFLGLSTVKRIPQNLTVKQIRALLEWQYCTIRHLKKTHKAGSLMEYVYIYMIHTHNMCIYIVYIYTVYIYYDYHIR